MPRHQTIYSVHSSYLVYQGRSRSHYSIFNSYFQHLLSIATFQTAWKDAVVTLSPKKTSIDEFLPSNYQSASNSSFFSKVLEKYHATADLVTYWHFIRSKFSRWPPQWHSTEKALVRVLSDIVDDIDKGHLAILMPLDLGEAFDTVDHVS